MKRAWKIVLGVAAASAALAAVVAHLGRGNFASAILSMMLCFHGGIAAAAVGLVAWAIESVRLSFFPPRAAALVKKSAFLLALALVIQVISVPLGDAFRRHDVRQAQQFCESLVPLLDAEKHRTGSYPKGLDRLLPGTALPRLLRAGRFYSTTGVTFTFTFADPASLFDSYIYWSDRRGWVRAD